ncbi:hypothetical protein [Aquabacter spiritensis]|uniref:Uncharacterized protein n=1 Tax=Aquabacter spiritensis TaxID=933073 RepID=A0A4R3LSU6_9HYPH|nr:hypothetical protein [Aquabacter spiritensis]TCT02609.1 hypothetical protein EDC64_11242 [Aquabacter spiritensis]
MGGIGQGEAGKSVAGSPMAGGSATRIVRLAIAAGCALLLAGCAGEGIFGMFGPKEPEVPQAPAGQYPTFIPAAAPSRPPVLDAAGQAKMEKDLEALGRQTQQKGEAAAAESP